MIKNLLFLLPVLALLGPAHADVYIYNTTDERMTYQVKLPNGDTKDGVIAENTGYYPAQTNIPSAEGPPANLKIVSESGQSAVEFKAPYCRTYVLYKSGGAMQFKPVSWSMDNGQTQKRELTILNTTGTTQTFDLVDEKEMRSVTLADGEMKTLPAKHGFGGSSGFHHLKFADGSRLDNAISSGYFCILYMDKRSPGKVQANNYGHLAAPRGYADPGK